MQTEPCVLSITLFLLDLQKKSQLASSICQHIFRCKVPHEHGTSLTYAMFNWSWNWELEIVCIHVIYTVYIILKILIFMKKDICLPPSFYSYQCSGTQFRLFKDSSELVTYLNNVVITKIQKTRSISVIPKIFETQLTVNS